MNLTISQNIFNSNYRNKVKKENQKKSNQTNAISKNQSFQVCSKQASQALKSNISFGVPQIPSDDAVSTMEHLYKAVTSRRVRPATAGIQNRYKQELIDNLRGFRNSNYDQMSIADNVLNNPDFLTLNNFAKVEQPGRNAFQIFAYPKEIRYVQSAKIVDDGRIFAYPTGIHYEESAKIGDDGRVSAYPTGIHYVEGVKIGENGQRLGNVGFVGFEFINRNGRNMLNSYCIRPQIGHDLSNLKVKLRGAPDPEREYEVRNVTDLSYIDYSEDVDEYFYDLGANAVQNLHKNQGVNSSEYANEYVVQNGGVPTMNRLIATPWYWGGRLSIDNIEQKPLAIDIYNDLTADLQKG